MIYYTFIVVLLTVFAVVSSEITNLTLITYKGPIIGLRVNPNPATNASYDAFIGIRYGQIPGRFQISLPTPSWTTPVYTQTDGPACPQSTMPYSEDCLYLNVFTPMGAANFTEKVPVMVFIHGSGFLASSSNSHWIGPDFLVPAGVILVAMNYRLGAPGFLTLGSQVAPGNLGLHDTRLALEWVRDEISAFGGDPAQVTLFGQSAGSAMTQFHYISSLSSSLFTKAIGHSGSALAGWSSYSLTEGVRRAKLLAQRLNCDITQNETVLLSCLQTANIEDVIANQYVPLSHDDYTVGSSFPFLPVLDTFETSAKPFFNSTSLESMMQQAVLRAKPFITGFTTDEGILKFMDDGWQMAATNFGAFIPPNVRDGLSEDERESLAETIKSRYYPDSIDENKVEDAVRLYTDIMFSYPSLQVSRFFANLTYGYLFAYNGAWAAPPPFFTRYKMTGVGHGADLYYLLYINGNSQYMDMCTPNLPNLNIKNQMVKWWTTFAKTGVPDPSWKRISEGGYLVIDSQHFTMNTTEFESQYYNFWANMEQTASSAEALQFSFLAVLAILLVHIFCH